MFIITSSGLDQDYVLIAEDYLVGIQTIVDMAKTEYDFTEEDLVKHLWFNVYGPYLTSPLNTPLPTSAPEEDTLGGSYEAFQEILSS